MRITNILLQSVSIVAVSVAFFGLSSCRTTDTDNQLTTGTKAQVNINFMGTAFKDEGLSPQASLKGVSTGIQKEQSHSVMLTPSSVLTTTLSPIKSKSSAQAGLKNSMAVVSGNPLNNGAKFRVIAYKSGDGSYQTYQDYTIGQTALPLTLDTGVAYNIVAYSYGTSSLPALTPGETSNINSAQIGYDNTNRDLMYVKQSYTPSSTNSTLNLTLMHQLMQITTSVTTNIGSINSIGNAVITPNFSDGSFPLGIGVMAGRTTAANQSIDFTGNTFPVAVNTPANATPVFINSNTTGNGASFAADINIGGTTKTVNLANSFDITPGTQNNLNITLSGCGAYLGPGQTQWKAFACQNLGATPGIDPFSPEAGNHGAKYEWGSTGKAVDQNITWIDQTTDQNNSGAIGGWNGMQPDDDLWNGNTGGGINNPCGTGYRVPTQTEWQSVLDNNTLERIGSWINDGNYTSAFYVKNASGVRTLMLPGSGVRNGFLGGSLNFRGSVGYYWSSTGDVIGDSYILSLDSNPPQVITNDRVFGLPVRCIAE